MNHRQLSYFLEVYKHRSITKAAANLFISPQALSKTIRTLEENLGITLFLRDNKKITPTKEAISLVSHAENILEEFKIISTKSFINKQPRKTLDLFVSYDSATYLSAHFYHDFIKMYPEIFLSISEIPDTNILAKLENGETELAILPGPIDETKFNYDYLFSDKYSLVVNRKHPLAAKEEILIKDLENLPILIKEKSPLTSQQLNILAAKDISPNIIMECSDYHVIFQMIQNGYGACILLNALTTELSKELCAIPFKSKSLVKTQFLVYKKNAVLSTAAMSFREFLIHSKTQPNHLNYSSVTHG